jgi:8-oxo-dGTP pyrophosphatase MutT (NUDIX family)
VADAIRDAATVLLLRDRASVDAAGHAPRRGGGVEVFMVKRHGASGFMAGAHVFPGGKLDAADAAPELLECTQGRDAASARAALGEPDLAAEQALGLFVAAARETFEEAGVLLAELRDGAALAAARLRLNEKVPFAVVLDQLGARLSLDRLVPLSRWITPVIEPRRFDTRFFLASSPPGQEASHDERETIEHAWLSPGEAFDRLNAGTLLLPPPTLRSLEWLAAHDSSASALEAAAAQPQPPLVRPIIDQADGKLAIILPGDPLHSEREPVLAGPTRIVLEGGRWWSKSAES